MATVGKEDQVLSDKIWEVRATDVFPEIIEILGVSYSLKRDTIRLRQV